MAVLLLFSSERFMGFTPPTYIFAQCEYCYLAHINTPTQTQMCKMLLHLMGIQPDFTSCFKAFICMCECECECVGSTPGPSWEELRKISGLGLEGDRLCHHLNAHTCTRARTHTHTVIFILTCTASHTHIHTQLPGLKFDSVSYNTHCSAKYNRQRPSFRHCGMR